MKHIILLITLLLFSPKTFATSDIATDIEQRYNSIKTWTADFEQVTFVEMLKQKLTKKGKIYVARPNKIKIEYLSIPNKIYLSNGKKLWIYKKNELTAWQFNKPKKIISKEALSFLKGLKNMSAIFDVDTSLKHPKGYLKIKDRTLKKVHLIPKNKDTVLKITLGVDAKNMILKEAILFNVSGNVTHYIFNNVKFDKPLPDSLFVLPKKPKRKIIKK